jgi:hypothetical protein
MQDEGDIIDDEISLEALDVLTEKLDLLLEANNIQTERIINAVCKHIDVKLKELQDGKVR